MKVYKGIDNFQAFNNPIVTTGTFDGVHLGHQKIIQRLKEIAKENNGETLMITFDPHPRQVLQPDSPVPLITSLEEKIELLESFGLDHLLIIPFTLKFSRTSSVQFIRDIIVNTIQTKKLVIGYDHQFGRNREGSFEHLKEYGPLYGFEVEEISAKDVDDVKVSSTKIRKAIQEGNIVKTNNYLGHPYFIKGKVVKGNQIGTKLGFPTANIEYTAETKLLPLNGVYEVDVDLEDKQYKGMLNIGFRPTVNLKQEEKTVEVHLINFDGDLYNKELKVFFHKRIREERSFKDIEELKQQLMKDREMILSND